jgi:hypothetical protein
VNFFSAVFSDPNFLFSNFFGFFRSKDKEGWADALVNNALQKNMPIKKRVKKCSIRAQTKLLITDFQEKYFKSILKFYRRK